MIKILRAKIITSRIDENISLKSLSLFSDASDIFLLCFANLGLITLNIRI